MATWTNYRRQPVSCYPRRTTSSPSSIAPTRWSSRRAAARTVLEFCRELKARKLDVRWMCNSRVDSIDAQMAAAMKDSGCTGISFGVESGVQDILDRVRKGTTTEQGREAIATVKAAGISSLAHFILGLPGETKETIRRTVAYAKEVDPDWAQFYCATPLPGTAMREELQQEGRLPQGPWSSLEFQKPHSVSADLTPEELRFERARAYAEFYLGPSVARRMLKRIRPREIGLFAAHTTTFVRSWVLSA